MWVDYSPCGADKIRDRTKMNNYFKREDAKTERKNIVVLCFS